MESHLNAPLITYRRVFIVTYNPKAVESIMSFNSLELVSHNLCPYVQRSVITLDEKNISHQRTYIDLSDKPDWFLSMSPTGKVPLLLVNERSALFESAVICEFLDEVTPGSLHPEDPIIKAEHRAWIEFASQILNNIARLYNAKTSDEYSSQAIELNNKFTRVESATVLPYFAGDRFSMVDAAFGPVFRYFDTMDTFLPSDVFAGCKKVMAWREVLSKRTSIKNAVDPEYPKNLEHFLIKRNSYISSLILQRQGAIESRSTQKVASAPSAIS